MKFKKIDECGPPTSAIRPFLVAVNEAGVYVLWPGPKLVNIHLAPEFTFCGGMPVPAQVRADCLAFHKHAEKSGVANKQYHLNRLRSRKPL